MTDTYLMNQCRILLLVLAALYSINLYAAGDTEFKQGLMAFRKGDYSSALKAFKKAEQAGLRSAALDYNLGVVYYKLGNLIQSKRYFNRLRHDKKLSQLADYNLGLIAEQQDNRQLAIRYYRLSLKGSDRDIRQLARYRISKLKAPADLQTWYGVASLSLGHDDNVTLIPTGSPTLTSDNYLEAFVYANYLADQQLSFNIFYDRLDYSTVDIADFSLLSAGADYQLQYAKWELTPGIRYSQSTLNSSSYQNIIDLRFSAARKLSDTKELALRYRYNDIKSQNSLYDYLEGTRQQFRADYDLTMNDTDLRLRYQLEINDRRDLPTTNYSPTRHTLQLRLKHDLNKEWQLEGRVEYRNSRYDEAAGIRREDDRYRLRAGARYLYRRDWDVRLRYTYTDNQSNIPGEAYTRNDIQATLNYSF